MNNEQWEELIEARKNEIMSKIMVASVSRGYSLDDCKHAAKEIVGVRLGGDALDTIASAMFNCVGRSGNVFNPDGLVTHLNNLPLGIKIADLQREEVMQQEPELQQEQDFIPAEPELGTKSLEQLCDEYEESVCTGKQSIEAQFYIMALEDLVSELQGKSFTDNSKISALEYDISKAYEQLSRNKSEKSTQAAEEHY